MPGPSDIPTGNIANIMLLQATLTPAAVVSATAPQQTFTVSGLVVGDFVQVMKPTAQAGLGISGARVTAANTLGITFDNPTIADITPTAGETYIILLVRRENQGNGLPKAFV
jgi:hypothetical protein